MRGPTYGEHWEVSYDGDTWACWPYQLCRDLVDYPHVRVASNEHLIGAPQSPGHPPMTEKGETSNLSDLEKPGGHREG